MATSHEEIEIKLRVHDLHSLRVRLKRIRARKIVPRTHESNTLFDTEAHDLRRRGQLIRVRIEHEVSARGQERGKRDPQRDSAVILTHKGSPVLGKKSMNSGASGRLYKIREEAEVKVTGAGEMAAILRALGLRPTFRYEKYRTTYALPALRRVKIELDETPVGIFLELEGAPAAIDRAASLLGYAREDYLTDSYGALYLDACRRSRTKPGNMLFPPTKKSRYTAVFP